ncbi:MAG TPA: universal stress protein [Candidatus Saccharimonadia bacterium]|nr:universal stress protein [Candidatus Saccharimonadia bacterium]
MKTIVALVDFSDMTFKLLKQAHQLASAFGSEVILLHVVSPDPVVVDFGMAPTVYRPPSPETIAAEGNRLAELQESLEKFGVRTTTRQIQGTRVEDLIEECRRLGAELIIVGSHGHGAVYNLLVGSITSQILKSAPCPVLVVPNGDKPTENKE